MDRKNNEKNPEGESTRFLLNEADINAFHKRGVASFEVIYENEKVISLRAIDYQEYIELGLIVTYADTQDRKKYIYEIVECFKNEFDKDIKIDPTDKELCSEYDKLRDKNRRQKDGEK